MTPSADIHVKSGDPWALRQAKRVVEAIDRRSSATGRTNRSGSEPVRPRWSLWLGYLALFSFVLLIVSGAALAWWFEPSMDTVTYDGGYASLRGTEVSAAYASTMDISFEVRGGLLVRQIHYWATHVFIATMALHLLRVFFTGGFRGRRRNWLIGVAVLVLGVVGAYTGHGLPDDLLSGTGLRVVEGGVLSIPVIGTGLSWLVFGGQYPGDDIISRLYLLHVFVIPGLVVALLVTHLIMARRHRRRSGGVDSARHLAKAGGLMLVVFGFIAMMAATAQINPIWLSGPYDPSQAGAGSRPDWYVGFLDGAQRLMPSWRIDVFGHELALAVFVPVIVLPGIMLAAVAGYPWIEQKILGVQAGDHVPDRPRWMPARTGLGAAFIASYVLLWIAGANDALATVFHVPLNWVTRALQVAVIVVPPVTYAVTTRICRALQRRARDQMRDGVQTGVVVVDADGGFSESRYRVTAQEAQLAMPPERPAAVDLGPAVDHNGVPAPGYRRSRLRARLVRAYYGDVFDRPSAETTATVHDDATTQATPVGRG